MSINVIKLQDTPVNYNPGASPGDASRALEGANRTLEDFGVNTGETERLNEQGQDLFSSNIDGNTIKREAQALTKFMQVMNANLQFEVHEKTNQLMVKLVDLKSNKVLREFPPHEFLDMIAKIQDYVGMLLDKKA